MTAETELLLDKEDALYTEYMNIYDRMLATQDLVSWDDALFYQTEELDLDPELDLEVIS